MTDFVSPNDTPPDPQTGAQTGAPSPLPRPLVDRVKAILLTPQSEWARIEAEPTSIGEIFRNYVVPLAAIGPIATLIGGLVFGHSFLGITYRPGVIGAVATALISYGLALGGIYVTALVIEALAPSFGAIKDRTRAYKVAAYAATASWIVGVFGAVPTIGFLSILGLYSLYLLWTGIPVLMKAPADKSTSYTVVSIVVMVAVGLAIGALTAPIAALFAGPATRAGGSVSGNLAIPGVGSVDMSKIEAATKKLERGEGTPAIPGATLQALLPASLPGLARTSVENSSVGAGGIGGSQAEAVYGSGDNEIRVTITDMGAMGAIAALGGAFGLTTSKENADGYERIGKVDGRMTTEKFDARAGRGEYGTIVADRVMVKAEGRAPSADALKAAVATIDLTQVAALAR